MYRCNVKLMDSWLPEVKAISVIYLFKVLRMSQPITFKTKHTKTYQLLFISMLY